MTWLFCNKRSFELADDARILGVSGGPPDSINVARVRDRSSIVTRLATWLGLRVPTDELCLRRTSATVTGPGGREEVLYVIEGVGYREWSGPRTSTVHFEPVCSGNVESYFAAEIAAEVAARRAELAAGAR